MPPRIFDCVDLNSKYHARPPMYELLLPLKFHAIFAHPPKTDYDVLTFKQHSDKKRRLY